MDFPEVARRARAVHLAGAEPDSVGPPPPRPPHDGEAGLAGLAAPGDVYGRICSSRGRRPPATLASAPSRKAVFVFGPDAVRSVILRRSAYESLCMLGFDQPYLHHKVGKSFACRFGRVEKSYRARESANDEPPHRWWWRRRLSGWCSSSQTPIAMATTRAW